MRDRVVLLPCSLALTFPVALSGLALFAQETANTPRPSTHKTTTLTPFSTPPHITSPHPVSPPLTRTHVLARLLAPHARPHRSPTAARSDCAPAPTRGSLSRA